MESKTASYLRSRFREYYLTASMDAPPGMESREWGFIFYDAPGMRRHRSFSSRKELVDYIRSTVPAHVYHSAAYYLKPDAPTMKEKIWKGADLIFDLDADHLSEYRVSGRRDYGEMLERVKRETMKLLEFLLSDFGFDEKRISVVFSGGRGYHIHVRDPSIMRLRSDARREIVDYLTGRGLDIGRFIYEIDVEGDAGVGRARSLRGPASDAPGWGNRINRAMESMVMHLRALDDEEAISLLKRVDGIGPQKAGRFLSRIREENAINKIRAGNLDFFKYASGTWKLIIPYLMEESVRALSGETDEPVTADVHRLIRFPESLHGGTGLRVTQLTIDSLRAFDPLRDAVVFGDDPVSVEVIRPTTLELMGERFDLIDGRAELPAYAAVFLMARGFAEIGR
ncbi:MAG: DNA primase small subunit PriS [Methanothrix sp.]|uniref:DNA primase small subunit PriS n=1 Tax=Methanothrix sp. TaxID=90426 RepID=UPI0025D8A0A0|nr:DNA primase small subunit PriS [Methanothrix sp.]MCQ8903501.1 DNA primase small subunit PriS [Methanothrix sp.]